MPAPALWAVMVVCQMIVPSSEPPRLATRDSIQLRTSALTSEPIVQECKLLRKEKMDDRLSVPFKWPGPKDLGS